MYFCLIHIFFVIIHNSLTFMFIYCVYTCMNAMLIGEYIAKNRTFVLYFIKYSPHENISEPNM
jgi:hypothetical protein